MLSTLLESIYVRTSQVDPVEMALLEGVVEQHGAASTDTSPSLHLNTLPAANKDHCDTGFPFGRYLGKLSTFHRSASSLIRWAQSTQGPPRDTNPSASTAKHSPPTIDTDNRSLYLSKKQPIFPPLRAARSPVETSLAEPTHTVSFIFILQIPITRMWPHVGL